MTDPALKTAWEYGFGLGTYNPHDEQFVDAIVLSRTDANGGSIWAPSLRDYEDISHRTFLIYASIQGGHIARANPWRWVRGPIGYAHQVRQTYDNALPGSTRCGRATSPDWAASDVLTGQCRVCLAEQNGSTGLTVKRTE